MSRIDELVKQYCPDGVAWMTLGDCIIQNIGGGTPSTANASYWGGDIPWASVGDLSVNGNYIQTTRNFITDKGLKNSSSKLVKSGNLIVAVKIAPGKAKIADFDVAINQDLRGLTLAPFITVKYLAYYFQTVNLGSSGTIVKAITKKDIEQIKIPVPPLPVQAEIVAILDKFSMLQSELQSELQARQQQYTYYRDLLLNFASENVGYHPLKERIQQYCPDGVEYSAMGEVGKFFRGNGLQKKNFSETGAACIHYGQIHTHYRTYADQTKTFISADLAKKLRKATTGDVIIATTSENDEDVCKAVAWIGNEKVAISGDAFIYQHVLHPKYVAYFFQTEQFQKQKKPYIMGTKVKRVSGNSLRKIKIPVPPLPVQAEIVAILDKFDILVHDLAIGLPAEIAARCQQYEYYRNQLLSFSEAV